MSAGPFCSACSWPGRCGFKGRCMSEQFAKPHCASCGAYEGGHTLACQALHPDGGQQIVRPTHSAEV